ncbi:DNA-3-methyladenine glycosylase family protein [Jannaschia faecimaris]|nr:DNA-3-methyladenine glycosylase 2 family protein [Jannaschia faecimaris]
MPGNWRIIETEADVAEGAAWLADQNSRFAEALDICGPLPLRRRQDGFRALLGAIVSQQVSVASANAIVARCEAASLHEPDVTLKATDEEMRACGLSRQKIRYIRSLAEAGIDFDALRGVPTDDVIATLTQVSGVGRWTAEIYAMFSLGHADVFASNDLALQEAARMLLDLPDRPKEKEMRAIAEDWSPWRAVAARLLWAYYAEAKKREGIR